MAVQTYDITAAFDGRYLAGKPVAPGQTQINLSDQEAELPLLQGYIAPTGATVTPDPAPDILGSDTLTTQRVAQQRHPTVDQLATYLADAFAGGGPHTHDAADIVSGVIDPARIPVIAVGDKVISTGAIADLAGGQLTAVKKGVTVITQDGRRWIYTGAGAKTDEASYIEMADVTPDWAVIANKPSFAAVATSGSASDLGSGTVPDARLSANVPILTGGKLPESVLPALAITETAVVASEAAMLALAAQVGDIAVRSDINKTFALAASPATTLANWIELRTPTDAVLSVAGKTGAVTLVAADVGLAAALKNDGDIDLNGQRIFNGRTRVNAYAGDQTIAAADKGAKARFTNAVAAAFTLPNNWAVGEKFVARAAGAGALSWALASQATISLPAAKSGHTKVSAGDEAMFEVDANSDGSHAVWIVTGATE